MAIGADGAIYLTDFATEQVRRYNRFTGEYLGVFVSTGAGGFGHCTDLTFGPDGQLYAANSATGGVLRFDGNTGDFQAAAVHPVLCASSRFMAFSPSGLFVTDAAANSVKRFDPSSGTLVGELACCISRARGIVATSWGEILVAGWDRNTITRFDAVTGVMLGDLVTNIHANGIAIGPDGYLYACEAARHRIERYDARTGEFLLSIGDGTLRDPWQLAFAPAPCAGDFNADGVTDFFDYLDFVASFEAADVKADFNEDGAIDFFDYLDFVAAFVGPCN
jgi:streptogramin lyase